MSRYVFFVLLYHRMCLSNIGYHDILNLWCVLCFHIISRASKLRSLFVQSVGMLLQSMWCAVVSCPTSLSYIYLNIQRTEKYRIAMC